jgi:hypothetical protein
MWWYALVDTDFFIPGVEITDNTRLQVAPECTQLLPEPVAQPVAHLNADQKVWGLIPGTRAKAK